MHKDYKPYYMFTSRSRIDKSINSLIGIIEGISIDGKINHQEANFLSLWLDEHLDVRHKHPFNELIPLVTNAISDGILSIEERKDISWLCERLRSTDFFSNITADLQRLHSILGGIAADCEVNISELKGLSEWLFKHEHLRRCWPYDEIDSIVTSVLTDQKIDQKEHEMLLDFFSEFVLLLDDKTITNPLISERNTISGVCAVCPEILFEQSVFCFTGASGKYTRSEFFDLVQSLGGQSSSSVSRRTNYLIIGSEGNPCWAYACYGRKVEKAVQLRKQGFPLLIVHENDFHDAVADL